MNYNTIENENVYAGTKLYNGNISETYWRTSNDNVKRKYSYHYDEQNRMKSAIYQRPNNSSPLRNNYDEHVFYDKNGNITQLIRNGEQDDIYDELMIDYLYYTYHPTIKNRLMKVMDETNSPAGFDDDSDGITDSDDDYRYDDFGNMTQDDNKGIQTISYNHLNLPVQITFSGATTRKINYLYNATGVKVKKTVTDGTVITETDYLDGYQYVKEGSNTVVLTFFPHAEGYVNNTVVNNANVYNYVYNYTDHLGNVRVVYTKDPTDGLVKILEENNYYPFGMKHKNYNMDRRTYGRIQQGLIVEPVCSTCPMYYNYKYNGKEFQDELGLNFYDYGARNYDPAIGRWMNIDPLAEDFLSASTYCYALNNPVYYVDPDGKKVINADEARKNEADDTLKKAQSDFDNASTEREKKKAQKALNEAIKAFDRALEAFNRTSKIIEDLMSNSNSIFLMLDTAVDVNGNKIDIQVTSAEQLSDDHDGGQTVWGYSETLKTIYAPTPGQGKMKRHQVTVKIEPNVNNPDQKLAHEGGHILSIIANPQLHWDNRGTMQGNNCRNPDLRYTPFVKPAKDLEDNYKTEKNSKTKKQ